jgi:hypothetical protein
VKEKMEIKEVFISEVKHHGAENMTADGKC